MDAKWAAIGLTAGTMLLGMAVSWGSVNARLNAVEEKPAMIEKRFDSLEHKIDKISDKIDQRIDRQDEKIDKLNFRTLRYGMKP